MSDKVDHDKADNIASVINAYVDVGEAPSLTGKELDNLARAYLDLSRRLTEALEVPTQEELTAANVSAGQCLPPSRMVHRVIASRAERLGVK